MKLPLNFFEDLFFQKIQELEMCKLKCVHTYILLIEVIK